MHLSLKSANDSNWRSGTGWCLHFVSCVNIIADESHICIITCKFHELVCPGNRQCSQAQAGQRTMDRAHSPEGSPSSTVWWSKMPTRPNRYALLYFSVHQVCSHCDCARWWKVWNSSIMCHFVPWIGLRIYFACQRDVVGLDLRCVFFFSYFQPYPEFPASWILCPWSDKNCLQFLFLFFCCGMVALPCWWLCVWSNGSIKEVWLFQKLWCFLRPDFFFFCSLTCNRFCDSKNQQCTFPYSLAQIPATS